RLASPLVSAPATPCTPLHPLSLHDALPIYWSCVNNSQVGLWYTATAFGFFLFAGVLALLIRAQLAVPDNDLLSAQTYNQVFTLRSEEHTSELQSRENLVCRLLLEKKKTPQP